MLSTVDQQQLDRVMSLVREVLGSDLVGACLFGSAVLGGLRRESDLDLLVVAKRPTTHAEKRHLINFLLAVSGRKTPHGMWRRIELTIVVDREIKPWRYPPRFDFQYGDWLRPEFESGNLEPWPKTGNPDLAILVTMVMLASTPVFGPPLMDIFDPVPNGDLLNAMVGDLDRLLAEIESDTPNVILTLARIHGTVSTGIIRSKDAAADWLLGRLPDDHRAVLSRARAIYLGEQEEQWDDLRDHIRPHAHYVVHEIRRIVRANSDHWQSR